MEDAHELDLWDDEGNWQGGDETLKGITFFPKPEEGTVAENFAVEETNSSIQMADAQYDQYNKDIFSQFERAEKLQKVGGLMMAGGILGTYFGGGEAGIFVFKLGAAVWADGLADSVAASNGTVKPSVWKTVIKNMIIDSHLDVVDNLTKRKEQ